MRLRSLLPLAVAVAMATVASPTAAVEPLSPVARVAPATPEGRVSLVSQPAWVPPGGNATFRLGLEGLPDGGVEEAELAVTVHRALSSRSAFADALDGKDLGSIEGRFTIPVADLTDDGDGAYFLAVGVEGSGSAEPPGPQRIVPGRSGVYPVRIDLIGARGRLDRLVTPLAVLAPGVVPLTVSWVWPLDATPAHAPDGTIRPAAAAAFASGGRLARMVKAAADHPDVPLTLAPVPETIEAWASVGPGDEDGATGPAATLSPLRAMAANPGTSRQLLGGPYVPIDVPAALDGDLDAEVDDQFAQGPAVAAEVLGTSPAPDTLLAERLGEAALGRLRLYGTERVVLAPSTLEPLEQRLTPSRPFLLDERGKPFSAAVADTGLADLLVGEAAPALRSARFLAALSLVALEAPRERRGVVVVMPADWDPPAAVLEATLDGLRGHPALTPGTLAQFFERVPVDERAGVPLERQLDGGDEGAFSSPDPAEVRAARSELVAFTGVVGSDRPVVSSVDRALLTSQSLRLPRSGPLSAAAYLEGATGMMHEVTGVVRGPDGQVTLTARQANVPVSLLNPNAFPLTVLVRLESDQLLFPDGAQRLVTLPPENTTEPFAVETRASGAFPLRITVTSPDGRMVVTRSELTIRSTVVSGVGAMLTAGAGVFLLVWWGNDLRRSRRRRRLSVQQH